LEKLSNRRIEDFPSTTLFFDDLTEIVNILANTCKKIEISTRSYKISNPNELELLAEKYTNGRFDDIYLQGYQPYIKIDLRTFGVTAYISEDTTEQRGTIEKIKEIVVKGKKLHPLWLFISFNIVIAPVLAYTSYISKIDSIVLILIVASISVPINTKFIMKNKVIVHTMSRSAKKSILKKVSDYIEDHKGISAFLGFLIALGMLLLKLFEDK
jgi:hypothetical protein